MVNDLFREHLDSDTAPLVSSPSPMALQEWQVDYLARCLGITNEDARALANKILSLPDLQPAKPAFLITKRRAALAAKQRQGKGPPSQASWRSRERNTKFRSQ